MFDLMPFDRNSRNLTNYFDNFEKAFFNDFPAFFSEMRTDILDKGDRYLLQTDLPGFQKDDIHIALNGDVLTVSAEHQDKTEEKDNSFIRRERRYGSFTRNYDVSGIDASNISASYQNGVLELTLPKANPQAPQQKQIEIQ